MKLKEEKNVPAFEGTLIRSDGDMYVARRPDGSTAVLQHIVTGKQIGRAHV